MPTDDNRGRKDKENIGVMLSLQFFESRIILEDTLEELDNLNSSFPATRDFLARKGLKKVTELDKDGMQELAGHLKLTLCQSMEKMFLAEHKVQSRAHLSKEDSLELDGVLSKIMNSFNI